MDSFTRCDGAFRLLAMCGIDGAYMSDIKMHDAASTIIEIEMESLEEFVVSFDGIA